MFDAASTDVSHGSVGFVFFKADGIIKEGSIIHEWESVL